MNAGRPDDLFQASSRGKMQSTSAVHQQQDEDVPLMQTDLTGLKTFVNQKILNTRK
jgi:hypothetical protein